MKAKASKLLSSVAASDRLLAIFVKSDIDVPGGSAAITFAVIANAFAVASLTLTPACLALSEASITLPIAIAAAVIFCAAANVTASAVPLLIALTKLNEPRSRPAGSPSACLSCASVTLPDAISVDSGDTTGFPAPSLAIRVSENLLPVNASTVCASETTMNFAPATCWYETLSTPSLLVRPRYSPSSAMPLLLAS